MSTSQERLTLSATPAVERLLARLGSRLRSLVWMHGIGTVLAVVAGWLAFAFFADRVLRVPDVIRLGHGVVLVALVAWFTWRALVRPLSRVPGPRGLALLFERKHPELGELLISAVEFQNPRPETDLGNPDLIQRVLRQAEEHAGSLRAQEVLDVVAPRKRGVLGLVSTLAIVAFGLWQPQLSGIFLDRLLGGSARWPQETHLSVLVPGLPASARVEETPELLRLRVARGTDLPIVVSPEGVVPAGVLLRFSTGRDLVLPQTGGGSFRTLLRSAQEDLSFSATGGDDEDGLPRVEVEVLQPPDVESIAIVVTPPAYSALPERVEFNQNVDVLAGSRVAVHVLPSPREATGAARVLPADELVPLTAAAFPLDPSAREATDAQDVEQPGLVFERVATDSFHFSVALRDDTGLDNPDPGLFRVTVTEDRVPEVQVLSPARTDFALVEGGAIPLRARAHDDFGVVDLTWRVSRLAADNQWQETARGAFRPIPIEAEEGLAVAGSVRLEVADLGTEELPVAVDQRFAFELEATDNQVPEPGLGRAPRVEARVVTPEELLRRMQDRLGRARMQTIALSDLQLEKRTRVEELLEALESDGDAGAGEAVALASALSGERRVLADAQGLTRELAGVAEDILYARLDERAEPLLERYDRLASQQTELRFTSDPWRVLAEAVRNGEVQGGGFGKDLVVLVSIALEIADDHVAAAVRSLDEAERAIEVRARLDALTAAAGHQTAALERIDALLEELAQWDNFQNILSLTRDILNRQKALRERTQQFASQK